MRRDEHLRYLPIEPLRRAILLKLAEYSEYRIIGKSAANSAQYDLSRRFADRHGGDPYIARRQLERLLNENKWVHEDMADRWCAVLGLHIDLLWDTEQPGARV